MIIKKEIIKGRLAEWYSLIERQNYIDKLIKEKEDKMINLRGISYDNSIKNSSVSSRDEKLSKLITTKIELEEERKRVYVDYLTKERQLRINELNEEQQVILKAVLKYGSYSKAGKEINYHKQAIYKNMTKIYAKLIKFL